MSFNPPSGHGDLMSLIHEAGFRGESANIMYAIVMAESGGNARAHNTNASTGDNSYGLAQINMLGSMGPARLREYGLRSNDDLFDPLTNLKVAYKMSGGGTHFGDWSTYNTGAYRQYLGQSGAQVTAFSGGVPDTNTGSGSTNAPLGYADYAQTDNLGNLLRSVPELHKLVQQATAQGWTLAKFQNEVENSKWYRDHSDTARSAIIQQANDPAGYAQRLNNATNSVLRLGDQLGFRVNEATARAIASNGLLTGNDSDQQWLTQQLGQHENYSHVTNTASLDGQMATNVQQLQSMAADYGYNWSPGQLAKNAQGIVMGLHTQDTFKGLLQKWAISAFPALAKDIQGGMTVRQLADPYVQSMSNLLEVPPGSLNLYTPLIRKALQGVQDPKTQQRQVVNLSDFEDQVRQDPRWQYTQNARDTMSQALIKLGSDFGFGPQG